MVSTAILLRTPALGMQLFSGAAAERHSVALLPGSELDVVKVMTRIDSCWELGLLGYLGTCVHTPAKNSALCRNGCETKPGQVPGYGSWTVRGACGDFGKKHRTT